MRKPLGRCLYGLNALRVDQDEDIMLYVACGGCRHINPLYCTGGFPPHVPILAFQGPVGAQCPFCGPMFPWFVCGVCGRRQMMFFPSMPPMFAAQQMPWGLPHLAPVVQAPAGLPGFQVNALISQTVSTFVKGAASELGKDFASALGGWIQDGFQMEWSG